MSAPSHHAFCDPRIDRAAERRGDRSWLLEAARSDGSVIVPAHGSKLWIRTEPPEAVILPARERVESTPFERWTFLGLLEGRPHFTFDTSELFGSEEEAGRELRLDAELAGLRKVATLLDRNDAALLAYANALVHWQRSTRYCGRCGDPTELRAAGHILHCPTCRREHYPRTSPAVIVLVHDGGDRCLLGRQASWPPGVYSTLAGFVEPGESLEEAVRREVREEVGVEVGPPSYDSSQPWPFPDSLMLGFHVEAVSSEIQRAEDELEDARWFTRSEVLARETEPRLPPRFSIARWLIDSWAKGLRT